MILLLKASGLVLALIFLWTIVRWFAGVRGGAPFVPVPRAWLDEALARAMVGPEDMLVDLGSGSGRILAAAAARGARVVGYEFHPFLVWVSRRRLRRYGDRARVVRGDLFRADVAAATVVCVFGLESMREKLVDMLVKQLRPGTRVIVFAAPELPFTLVARLPHVRVYRVGDGAVR